MHLHKLHSRYATNFGAVQNKRRKTSTIWFFTTGENIKAEKRQILQRSVNKQKDKMHNLKCYHSHRWNAECSFFHLNINKLKKAERKRIFCIYAQIKADLVKYELNGIWNPTQPKHIYCFVEYCRNIMAGWISFFPSQVSGGGSFHVLLNPIQNQNFLSRFELIFIFCIPLLLSLAHCGNMLRPPAALLKISS